jgi:hypothetical protein
LKVYAVVFVILLFGGLFVVVPSPVLAKSSPLELQWSQTYDHSTAMSMFQVSDGGVVVAGSDTSKIQVDRSHVPSEVLIMKIDVDKGGEVEWRTNYPVSPASLGTFVQDVKPTSDGGHLLLLNLKSNQF